MIHHYQIQLPSTPPGPNGYALWLYLHGAFATADQGQAIFGDLANAEHAILLTPQATRACGDGYCWSFAHDAHARRQLLDHITAIHPINPRLVSMIGYSMGCTVGFWLLAQNPTTFAAFAALGMGSTFELWEHDDGGVDPIGLQQSARFTRVLLAVDQYDPVGTNDYFNTNLAHLEALGFTIQTIRPTQGTHAISQAMKIATVEYLIA